MLQKKFEKIFLALIFSASTFLLYNYYKSYTFKHNDLPQSYKTRIANKEQEVLSNMQKHFGFRFKVPLIVSDKIPGRLYGLTSYDNGNIAIYLNKKVMQESMDYMVESVIAHEYAHALMFHLGHIHTRDNGHSKEWQKSCQLLGGKDCQQYVDQEEIIMSKVPFLH